MIRTLLDLLQTTTHALIWSTDDIYACDFFWVCLLQFVQCAERIDAEGVCATEQHA
jgi:hypothetical protein